MHDRRHSQQSAKAKPAQESSDRDERADQRAVSRVSTSLIQARYGSGAAAAGVNGPGTEFPHKAALETSFGMPITARAHTGTRAQAACKTLGAEAYAFGDAVAFRAAIPDKHTAAHEAVHTLQQRRGSSGGAGAAGDGFENQADIAADAAVAGWTTPLSGAMLAGAPALQCKLPPVGKCNLPAKSPLPADVEKDLIKMAARNSGPLIYGLLHTLSMTVRATILSRIADPKDALGKAFAKVDADKMVLVRKVLTGTTVDVGDYGQPEDKEAFAGSMDEKSVIVTPATPVLGSPGGSAISVKIRGAKPASNLKVNVQLQAPGMMIAHHGTVDWKAAQGESEAYQGVVVSPGKWSVVVEVADGHRALRRIRSDVDVVKDAAAAKAKSAKPDVVSGAAKPAMVSLGGTTHIVGPGDSLWSIAKFEYSHGRYWRTIRNANKGKIYKGGRLVHDGVELDIPTLGVPALTAASNFAKGGDKEGVYHVAATMDDDTYAAFLSGLSKEEAQANGELIQLMELMRSTGKTIDELAVDQQNFLEAEAKKKGVSVGELIAAKTSKHGYTEKEPLYWRSQTKKQQAEWRKRYRAVIKSVKASAPDGIKKVIKTAQKHGGGFKFDPAGNESMSAFAYTRTGKWTLVVGVEWVKAAETGPERVYSNIAHEMGGHNEYGDELGWDIMGGALANLPEDEQTKANSRGNVWSAWGYAETEIWAELREHEFDDEHARTDHPTGDVTDKLHRIRKLFAKNVGDGLIKSLWTRVKLDSRVTKSARRMFRESVRLVFAMELS